MPIKPTNQWKLKTIAMDVTLTCLPAIAEDHELIAEEREI